MLGGIVQITRSLGFGLMSIVVGLILYHIALKTMPRTLPPVALIAGAYAIGTIILFTYQVATRTVKVSTLNWRFFVWTSLLAAGLCLIELGYAYAYQNGLPISTGNVVALALVSLILFPLGLIVFRETFSLLKMLGLFLALGGLYLLSRE
jgi:drug/metabolite transporter (DMT)-like permease